MSQPGDWQGLDGASQRPRYEAIAAMLRAAGLDRTVLDVGCGEAVLRDYLPAASYYRGIEPCGEAIMVAAKRPRSGLFCETAEDWYNPGLRRFSAVVFNESLYYAADPIDLVRRYATYLRPGGAVLVSIYQRPGRAPLRKRLAHWLDRRRPMSNQHCEAMVVDWQRQAGWTFLDVAKVPQGPWHVWLARPPGGSV